MSSLAQESPYAMNEARPGEIWEGPALDYNGVTLYDRGYLFLEIIQQNDVPMLKQYFAKFPLLNLKVYEVQDDPYVTAAAAGNTDVLRVLLEDGAAKIDLSKIHNGHEVFLLMAACAKTRLDTARFLLDEGPRFRHAHPRIGDIQSTTRSGRTALLAAAQRFLGPERYVEDYMTYHDMQELLPRIEEVMNMLLDRGASAQDRLIEPYLENPEVPATSKIPTKEVVCDTVLSLAITHASSRLVKRLIEGGADVHITTKSWRFDLLREPPSDRRTCDGITPLHIGSYHLNVEGVQALLDHQGNGIGALDMVSCRDSHGCLPLHWAASAFSDSMGDDYMTPAEYIAPQRISIFKLLLAPDPASINARDNNGETVLSLATRNPGQFYYRSQFDTLKFLCANGADASIRDNQGRNALHWLGSDDGGEPIDIKTIDLLLVHGAKIGDTDQDGNTPLHLIASCISQSEAVKFLISRGADASMRNLHGDIPLHKAAIPNGSLRRKEEGDYIKAMEETVRVLEEAGGDPNAMDQPNSAGKTPRQLCHEFRRRWEGFARDRLERAANRGFGRGRNLGSVPKPA